MARKILLSLITIAISLLAAYVVYAQQGGLTVPTDDQVNAVAKKLYCPVCPNTPLDVCETKACQDWRAKIREQLSQGWSEDQIIAYFVNQYGERVLGEPQRKGFTSMVWVLPVIAVLIGLLIVWQVLHSWQVKRKPLIAPSPASPQITPEIQALIEKELKELG